jgi:endonuclease/exonuclease/phosphatase family metal-dependent hydrolase
MRVLTYNILDGGVGREPLIAEVLDAVRPDVAVLQEVYPNGLAERLAAQLSMQAAVVEGNSTRHMALLSRWPIAEARGHHPYPPIHHVTLEATLRHPAAGRLHVFGVHTVPLYSIGRELWRAWEVGTVLRRARCVDHEPCLVMGDFNAVAPRDVVRFETRSAASSLRFWVNGAGKLRLAVRRMHSAGFTDCYRSQHPTDPGYTLPPPDPGVRLDYIFANASLASLLQRCDVVVDPPAVHHASDHYPVLAVFDLPG